MVLQNTRRTLRSIERIYARDGYTGPEIRSWLVRKLGIGPGTLENIQRDRVKSVSAELALKISKLFEETVLKEIGRLEHDLQIARQIGAPLSADEVAKAEDLVAQAKKIIGGE